MKPILLFTCLLLAFSTAFGQEGLTIDSLRVEGLRFASEERVLLEFGIVPGDEVQREELADALRRLHRSQRFEDLSVRAERNPDSTVDLLLVVREYPKLAELRWEGLKKIGRDDLEELVRVTTGSYLRPLLLVRDEAAILEHCGEKGYHAAQVESRLETSDGRSSLTFALTEGKKSKIKALHFEGNASISGDHLRQVLGSKPKRYLNPLSWQNFNAYQPDSISADVGRLTRHYHQEGFLDARVLETREAWGEEQDKVALTYVIDEGPRYEFGRVHWEGNSSLSDSLVQYYLPFQPGETFNGYELDRSVALISEAYYDRGYLYNQVLPERSIEERKVDLLLRIAEGPLARVREIIVAGNDKTLDKVIRREIKIYPGELFNREKVIRSHRDIFMLRYFDDVQFEPRTDPSSGEVDLLFRVLERSTGNFSAGIPYSEATSLTGFITVGATNFRGRGQTLNFQWEFGKRVHLFNIHYVEPWFRNRPVTLSGSIYRSRNNIYREYYKDEKIGFSTGLGRPFPWLDHSRISAAYRLESIELFDFSDEYLAQGGSLVERDWPEVESSVTLTFWRNSTDNPFLPSRGTRFRISGQFAGGLLGGNLAYQKYMSHYTWYQKLVGPFVLRFHQTLGLVDGIDRPEQVPDQERFRLGGNRLYPLRGYHDFSVVPEGNSSFLGGRAMTTGAVEVVLGVSNNVQIVAPFFDFGGTWNSMAQADFTTLKRSVGFGARIEIPLMGVMGFDWGYPLDPEEGEEKGRFHFKMGTDF